jgi:antitoxin component YwqK of YwqJK toxin-antitoxin module
VPSCELNGKSVNPYNGSTTKGLTGIMRCKEESTGLPTSEQELRGGVFMGLSRFYDSKGNVQRERMINERGTTDGFEREFWPNGKLRSESNQNNGSTRGASRRFFETGKIDRVSFTLDGQVLATASWDRDGLLTDLDCAQASVVPEVNKLCGFEGRVQTALFENGKRRELRTMEQGKVLAATIYRPVSRQFAVTDAEVVVGELAFQNGQLWHRVYNTEGAANGKNVLREERLYEPGRNLQGNEYRVTSSEGRLQWSKAWGANEQLLEHIRYTNGRPNLTERWYLNGAMKEKITVTLDGGGSRSVRESYNDDGKMTERQSIIAFGVNRDQLTGLQQSFHANGKVAVEDTYSKPDEHGRTRLIARKQWDQNGKLQSDDDILEDGSRRRGKASEGV